MNFHMTAKAAAVFTAGLLAGAVAHADTQTLSGQYLDVTFDTAQIPFAFGNVSLVETPFEWDCASGSCTMIAPPSVSVVFGSVTGNPVSMTQLSQDFNFTTTVKDAMEVIDPTGHNWGVATADKGKWEFGTNIAEQVVPANAAFAMAFGQFKGHVAIFPTSGHSVLPTWSDGSLNTASVSGWSPSIAFTESATVLGLSQTGWVGFGPGPQGESLLEEPGVGINDAWRLRADLISAYYALPSSSNPRCQSLSCMSFAEGILKVDSYAFKMAVVTTPSPVPEAQTAAMAMAGLGLIAWVTNRRRSHAQA